MTIDLTPEYEQVIGQAIRAGLIQNPEEIVTLGVETVRRHLESRNSGGAQLSTDQWLQEFHDWVHSHRDSGYFLYCPMSLRYSTSGRI
jgi:hypothetical protein